ncbi:hypothetical protein KUD97_07930 [Desulfovibrio desulfuricans]|uniref:Internal virion protein B n=1 Tax=Desulfovibrio phage ProddE TaxID=2866661 RepID=A0AAE9BM95_9CAUD|nr:hypothetical protein [Desulfovibrio desulfuricans]UAJ16912.1 internal virion protein B [Desulfovibrio phage ProddE]UIA98919.1 hypothetical protein KUD97_07930 [Desulfovibrio desulfuricans]
MCDGGVFSIPITSMLIGTATALAGAEQSRQQAEAQANYQEAQAAEYARVSDLNNKAAVQEYANQAAAERITQMQEQEATSEKIQETQREALEKKGTMLASTNAAGGALTMLMADYDRQEAMRKDSMRHQLDMSSVNHELNIAAMHDKAQNRINSQANYVSPGVSSTNSFLTTALGIGSSAITAFGYYDKYSNKGANDIKAVKKEP